MCSRLRHAGADHCKGADVIMMLSVDILWVAPSGRDRPSAAQMHWLRESERGDLVNASLEHAVYDGPRDEPGDEQSTGEVAARMVQWPRILSVAPD